MLDVKDLEKRWLKYKLRSYAPYGIGGIIFVLLVSGLTVWLMSPSEPVPAVESNQSVVVKEQPAMAKAPAMVEENAMVLEPAMGFVQSFQNTVPDEETLAPSVPKPVSKPSNTAAYVPPPKVLQMPTMSAPSSPAVQPVQPLPSKSEGSLSINRNESKLDIEELKQRFKETSNANLGLFIARYHYDHGNYAEAYNYALKTNSINNKIDDSWILFSKSLVKLGKTEQAKKTLQLYIQQSNSENAKGLLESIEKGTFK